MDPMGAGKPVGLKLEISPEIMPRDTSIGTKIFTLVPNDARNVREVKTYLGNFVLKTPAPFHIFMGEYRIRDEEDVQIFSVIDEPCRLLPVPKPRPALSSTPKVKTPSVDGGGSGSNKRVTFFDSDLSASPVTGCGGMGSNGMAVDVLDHSHPMITRQTIIHSPQQFVDATVLTPSNDQGNENVVDDSSTGTDERKKRRRRRHRSKKTKSTSGSSDTETGGRDGESKSAEEPNGENGSSGAGVDTNSTPRRKRGLDVLNEETESEEETNNGNPPEESDDNFQFVTPVMPIRAGRGRGSKKSETQTAQNGTKKKKLSSDSAFSSPGGSFSSPISSVEIQSSGKVRQDTPVPRVIRNPRFFESARKIINDFSIVDSNESQLNDSDGSTRAQASSTNSSIAVDENGMEGCQKTINDCYASLESISNLDSVQMGDKIAFRVLELDERYNPSVSDFKEGIVIQKGSNELTIQYTKNNVVNRNGKYEFQFEDTDDHKTDAMSADFTNLKFSELMEPKLVHRSHPIAVGPESVWCYPIMDQ